MINIPDFMNKIPSISTVAPIAPLTLNNPHLANAFYDRLIFYINDFEENLTEYEEVALKLVSFGETVTIIVDNIGYYNPSLISFSGVNLNNERVQLIQNVAQISFLLIAAKSSQPIEPRQRIGFRLKHEKSNEEGNKE